MYDNSTVCRHSDLFYNLEPLSSNSQVKYLFGILEYIQTYLYFQDWCTVEGSCGEYSLSWGHWDYCWYKDSSKPDYLALNWETKHDQLWSEIKSDSSLGEYYPTQMFTESLITTFENEWDVLPEGRNKAIHGNGAICPFTVDVSNGKIYSVNCVSATDKRIDFWSRDFIIWKTDFGLQPRIVQKFSFLSN